MAAKIIGASAPAGKKETARRAFLAALGGALLAPAAALAVGEAGPRLDMRAVCARVEYLMSPEFDRGVQIRRGMTGREVAEYLDLQTSGEKVAFLDAMGAVDQEAL